MKRLLVVLAALILIAATPDEVVPGVIADGYYIESGSDASEQTVSDAVFEGRASGGRLYIVVLSEEPSGGATTFSDSVLDRLDGEGYVVTIAPETVGFAMDGAFWTFDEMDRAVDDSLAGGSDSEVVELFIRSLTGQSIDDGGSADSPAVGTAFVWVLLIGAGIVLIWVFIRSRDSSNRAAQRLEQVKALAREKLNTVANDVLEMEDEVAVSDNREVKGHYSRASSLYTKAIEETERAATVEQMLQVGEELDLAIWELDCAEAILDGKERPPKPEPPGPEPTLVVRPTGTGIPQVPGSTVPPPGQYPPPSPGYDRRPQRQSSGSSEMMTMLMTMMAMRGLGRGRGGFFGGGTFGRMSGGGTRMGGGGRMRGGGHRRG